MTENPPTPIGQQQGGMTDEDLVMASRTDGAQFAAVFEHQFAPVHAYLSRRVGTDLADELAGETFVQAFQHRDRYDAGMAPVRAWLLGIATNLLRHHHRGERRRLLAYARVPVERTEDDLTSASDTRLTAETLAGPLGRALASMRARDRDVLLLVAWGDLTYQEVAGALGVPIGTVRSRLSRARRQVRAGLPQVNDWSTQAALAANGSAAGGPKGVVLDG